MAERKAFLLRIDPKLHDALARWASDDLRSLNGQIEFLLRRALAGRGRLPGRLEEAPEREGGAGPGEPGAPGSRRTEP